MSGRPDHLPHAPAGAQRLILRLLLSGEEERLWPLEAVVHHVGNPIVALDALVALSDAGLVHRWSSYVIPTRAAMHFFWLFS
jgi:hypothetical protein